MSETKFKCDCGFEWIKGYSGHHQCGSFYMEKVDGLKQELDAYKAHVALLGGFVTKVRSESNKRVLAITMGSYFKMMVDRCNDILAKTPAQSLDSIQAQAVTDLISECSYSGVVDGTATSIIDVDSAIKYADRLREG